MPATKCLILFIGTISVLASIFGLKQHFHLQLTPHITVHHQVCNVILFIKETFTNHFTSFQDCFYRMLHLAVQGISFLAQLSCILCA